MSVSVRTTERAVDRPVNACMTFLESAVPTRIDRLAAVTCVRSTALHPRRGVSGRRQTGCVSRQNNLGKRT